MEVKCQLHFVTAPVRLVTSEMANFTFSALRQPLRLRLTGATSVRNDEQLRWRQPEYCTNGYVRVSQWLAGQQVKMGSRYYVISGHENVHTLQPNLTPIGSGVT